MDIKTTLAALYNNIPRRYSVDNIIEINNLLQDYENVLIQIEATNTYYEKGVSSYFDEATAIRLLVKQAANNKNAKKAKDDIFAEASTALKDSIEGVQNFWGDGKRVQ